LDEFWRKEQKYAWLNEKGLHTHVEWQEITPDKNHTWLTEGMHDEFETFLPMGTKETKAAKREDVETIFKSFSLGVNTNRDAWVFNFDRENLAQHVESFIETYNHEVYRWYSRKDKQIRLDDFVLNDDTRIKWSSRLKECLLRGQQTEFSPKNIHRSLYRPFASQWLYFDSVLTHRQGQFPHILPTSETESENRVICVTGLSSEKPFMTMMASKIVDMNMVSPGAGGARCFPFYTYNTDGSNRKENITDWALEQFRARYGSGRGTAHRAPTDGEITKWDIFHYVYAILHHPQYREKYAANLKRELPRIPFVGIPTSFDSPSTSSGQAAQDDKASHDRHAERSRSALFWDFAKAGEQLADLHVNYEHQPKYPLTFIETEGEQLDWRVEKMKLSKDRIQIVYNHFLTLVGIPPETFEYRLGNRSALHWIIDQYRVKTDKRSGIVNDPNRADEPDYIVNLIQRVITVSVETVKIVKALPVLEEIAP
jgi:predicted helicase